MKHPSILIRAALLLALCASGALLPSCTSNPTERREQLSQVANTAITVAELSGKLNPKQAALLRKGGVLVLDMVEGKKPEMAALSEIAVEVALERKAITQEQADQLQAAGVVPIATSAPETAGFPALNPPTAVP